MLFDFVEASLAEVFASEQFGLGACREVSEGVDIESLEGFSAAYGEFDIGDGLVEDFGGDVAGDGGHGAAGRGFGVFEGLSEAEAFAGEQRLDFAEAGFAEVLVAEEFGFGDFEEVAEGSDVHFFEAISAAHGEFEVGDGDVEDGVSAVFAVIVVIEVHGASGVDVFEVEAGTFVIGIAEQDGAEAAVGLFVVVVVFVEDSEIDEGIDVDRGAGADAFVEFDGLGVIGLAVVEEGQAEAGLFVVGVFVDGSLVEFDGFFVLALGLGLLGLAVEFFGGALVDGRDCKFAHGLCLV